MSLPSHQAMLANKLLAALPRAEFDRLAPHLEQVNLSKDTILYDAGDIVRHAYFLQSGMISLLSVTDEEDVIEVRDIEQDDAARRVGGHAHETSECAFVAGVN